MPVLIEGLNLVAKRGVVERLHPGGLAGFAAAAPRIANPYDPPLFTFVADDHLARVGFTNSADVAKFCKHLQQFGFECAGDPVHLVVVSAATGSTVACEWIELRDYAVDGGVVQGARLRGTTSHDLWVPVDWAWATSMTANMVAAPDEVLERAELVGGRDGVQFFHDPREGRLRILGRAV